MLFAEASFYARMAHGPARALQLARREKKVDEVAEMAHQGAKVLHPRAAEIAMLHQIPLWVKSSFVDSPGTRVAALAEVQPPDKRGVTGINVFARKA